MLGKYAICVSNTALCKTLVKPWTRVFYILLASPPDPETFLANYPHGQPTTHAGADCPQTVGQHTVQQTVPHTVP